MTHFLTKGASSRAVRTDTALNHLHWSTTRDALKTWAEADHLYALAIDHRSQLEAIADKVGASRDRIPHLKRLAVDAAAKVAQGRAGFGMLLDGTYGREALFRAEDHRFWIGRPVELPGSRPLDFEGGGSIGAKLIEWPRNHTIKILCFYHPDDSADLKARQDRELLRIHDAARRVGREILIEIICGKHGVLVENTSASVMHHLYNLGIKPDWWKLEPQTSHAAWNAITHAIDTHDPSCRGIVMLGLEAPEAELASAFQLAKSHQRVKGFAVGRTIFAKPAEEWLTGRIDDQTAMIQMAQSFQRLVDAWERS
jgi:5-dehydro-2-deoxygluconokinase